MTISDKKNIFVHFFGDGNVTCQTSSKVFLNVIQSGKFEDNTRQDK